MIRRTVLLSVSALLIILGLSACGSVPPAPVDRFFRLQASEIPAAGTLPIALEIRNVRADSLYAERPIVFSDAADPRQLRQYHYHLWLYPPAQLVREHMRSSFGTGSGAANGTGKTLTMDARIVSFERLLDGKRSSAKIALEVTLLAGDKSLLVKRYQAAQTTSDDSFSAFAVAMEEALSRIYGEILRDTNLLPAEPR
ncbi:MAG: membrane integrity-associated transporter subunit PqiC [Zoogloeaceae bacterium]|nr:membrane integrity-associated transporter subunit PqiC [Zoogloeaceae bacterium]